MGLPTNEIDILEKSSHFYVFGTRVSSGDNPAIRILDKKGFIKVQRASGKVIKTTAENYVQAVEQLWDDLAIYQTEVILRPDFYICAGPRVMDFSVNDLEALMLLIDIEMSTLDPNEEVMVLAANSL